MLLPGLGFAQHTLTGKVTDAATTETLVGSSVYLEPGHLAQSTSADGSFRFTNLSTGTYTLRVTYIGYREQTQQVEVTSDHDLNVQLQPTVRLADEVIVSATRATERTPTTYTTMSKEELQERNFGQDLPYLLDQTPSAVTTSDAGAGVGYTGLRIRGTDLTRINVTLNGIPVNEAESHSVFFVDIPDLGSSVQSVQVQRGVGTSTNGPGAFGGSVNIQTTGLNPKAYAEATQGYGSFNTLRTSLSAGTGLINNKFAADVRLSRISSDGYIDRASSKLQSVYLSGGYFGEKTMLKAVIMRGHERTYQAWNGVPQDSLKTNRTFNISGTDRAGKPYENEVDDYGQQYYQLHFSHQLTSRLTLNLSGFQTLGGGYYEQYRTGQRMSTYGIAPQVFFGTDSLGNPQADTLTRTDVIRRRWLKTNLYGGTWALQHNTDRLNLTLGGAAIGYDGEHFGELIWARHAGNTEIGDRYYQNRAYKTDFNSYFRAIWQATDKLSLFGDVQGRLVEYSFFGANTDGSYSQQKVNFSFFNPKAGLTYNLSERTALYASYAVAHREPTRSSYTDVPATRRPTSERLYNLEAGIRRNHQQFTYSANYYLMQYKNQLVLTGTLDDVGNPIHQNVPDSYRTGLELSGSYQLLKQLRWTANATFSRNKISRYTEYMADYDNGGETGTEHKQTDIAFSPNLIAGSQLIYQPLQGLELAFISKYVSRQYLDNTQSSSRQLDAYFVNDVRLRYVHKTTKLGLREVELALLVQNVFNELYENNGYTYSYVYGGQTTTENWYYPQATRNVLGQVSLRF